MSLLYGTVCDVSAARDANSLQIDGQPTNRYTMKAISYFCACAACSMALCRSFRDRLAGGTDIINSAAFC